MIKRTGGDLKQSVGRFLDIAVPEIRDVLPCSLVLKGKFYKDDVYWQKNNQLIYYWYTQSKMIAFKLIYDWFIHIGDLTISCSGYLRGRVFWSILVFRSLFGWFSIFACRRYWDPRGSIAPTSFKSRRTSFGMFYAPLLSIGQDTLSFVVVALPSPRTSIYSLRSVVAKCSPWCSHEQSRL